MKLRRLNGRGAGRGLRFIAAIPLLFALISLPLMFGLIEPNPIYGVRTAATFASDDAWYRANRASGMAGVAAGIVGFLFNMLVVRSDAAPPRKIAICIAVLLMVTLVMVLPGLLAA